MIKDTPCKWTEECQKAFEKIINLLASTFIIQFPDWFFQFKLMCDANDYTDGALLGKRKECKPSIIYYVSKTLNSAK